MNEEIAPGASRGRMKTGVRALLGLVATSAPGSALTDDQFLDEIEAAVRLRRAHSLRALDALTPTAGDFRELPVGQR